MNAEKNEVINQFEGMVLKELALKKHDEFEESCMRYVSPATKKEDKKQLDLYKQLKSKLEAFPELLALFNEYENQTAFLIACTEEDHFIHGFIEGAKITRRLEMELS